MHLYQSLLNAFIFIGKNPTINDKFRDKARVQTVKINHNHPFQEIILLPHCNSMSRLKCCLRPVTNSFFSSLKAPPRGKGRGSLVLKSLWLMSESGDKIRSIRYTEVSPGFGFHFFPHRGKDWRGIFLSLGICKVGKV